MKNYNELRRLAGLPLIAESDSSTQSLNETVLHDMLDELIKKIGRDCGVDFKDADGEAVKKAMSEIYHAGAGKGRYA